MNSIQAIDKSLEPKLKDLADTDKISREVLNILSSRERAAQRIDVDSVFRELEHSKKTQFDYFKYIDVWRKFQELGLGQLVHGRKGNPNRFVWYVNLRHVGRIALNKPLTDEKPEAKTVNKVNNTTITFVIPETVNPKELDALIKLAQSISK